MNLELPLEEGLAVRFNPTRDGHAWDIYVGATRVGHVGLWRVGACYIVKVGDEEPTYWRSFDDARQSALRLVAELRERYRRVT